MLTVCETCIRQLLRCGYTNCSNVPRKCQGIWGTPLFSISLHWEKSRQTSSMDLTLRTHIAEKIWKRSFVSIIRPTVHTNPSLKRSFWKRSSKRRKLKTPVCVRVVSFAAVIRVVTQRSSPLTAAHSSSAFLEWAAVSEEDRCVTTLITVAKEISVCADEKHFENSALRK